MIKGKRQIQNRNKRLRLVSAGNSIRHDPENLKIQNTFSQLEDKESVFSDNISKCEL